LAANRSVGAEQIAVHRALGWARRQVHPDIRARALSWVGRLRYDQGRFSEAARFQSRASRVAIGLEVRMSCQLNAASAWMEAGVYDEARNIAERAFSEARRGSHPIHEAHAEWLLRACAYRADDAGPIDDDLIAAVAELSVPYLQGLILLNEAAISWRIGDQGRTCDLAQRARKAFIAANQPAGGQLAYALELHCSPESSACSIAELAEQTIESPTPDISWQILGLLAATPRGMDWREQANRAALMGRDPHRRREILAPVDVQWLTAPGTWQRISALI
jgi:hypothetical protein